MYIPRQSPSILFTVVYNIYIPCVLDRQWDVIAGQLHALLDDPPWTPEGK